MSSLTKDSTIASRTPSGLSWRDQTLNSMSAPPMQLVALLGLVILLLSMSSYTEFKVQIEREKMGLKLLLYLFPLALFVVTYVTMRHRLPYMVQAASTPSSSGKQDGTSPWGVAFLVILVLVLVKYHSSVQSGEILGLDSGFNCGFECCSSGSDGGGDGEEESGSSGEGGTEKPMSVLSRSKIWHQNWNRKAQCVELVTIGMNSILNLDSDKRGYHNFDLLKKLVLPGGSVLLVVCVINFQGAGWCKIEKKTRIHDASPGILTGSVQSTDVDALAQVAGQDWEVVRLPKGVSLPVTLKVLEYKLFYFCPLKETSKNILVAPLDKYALVRAFDVGIVARVLVSFCFITMLVAWDALYVFTIEPPPKENILVNHENVTITPHLGASTMEAQEGVAIEIAEGVVGALQGA
ncbi:probable galactinol--sucrose galactosyltransferase 2 [Tanacetum coccineum]